MDISPRVTERRTAIESMLLNEMREEDSRFLMECDIATDEIIATNTIGLFDDITTSEDDISDILDDEDIDIF